jgi:hypothetical protein
MNHQTINQQLHGLLVKLHQLGQDHPQVLIYLTQIAQPKLPQNLIIPFLGQMFEKLPPFLSKIEPPKLQQLIKDPPADAVPLRILIDLLGIQQLLQQITVLQLLHLTNNTIPPGSQESQEAFLKKVLFGLPFPHSALEWRSFFCFIFLINFESLLAYDLGGGSRYSRSDVGCGAGARGVPGMVL